MVRGLFKLLMIVGLLAIIVFGALFLADRYGTRKLRPPEVGIEMPNPDF